MNNNYLHKKGEMFTIHSLFKNLTLSGFTYIALLSSTIFSFSVNFVLFKLEKMHFLL